MQHLPRTVRADEWEAYRSLRLQMLRDSPKAFDVRLDDAASWPDRHWQAATSSRLLPDSCWFVLDGDTGWLGSAQGRRYRDRCYLLEVYVVPSFRGSGAVDALVAAVAEWALAQGFDALWLDVGEQQLAARRAYERLGFERTGVTGANAAHPDVTEHEMVLRLTPQPRSS